MTQRTRIDTVCLIPFIVYFEVVIFRIKSTNSLDLIVSHSHKQLRSNNNCRNLRQYSSLRRRSSNLPRTGTTQFNFVQLVWAAYQRRAPFSSSNKARIHTTRDYTETMRVYLGNVLARDLVVNITRVKFENSRVNAFLQFFHAKWAILASRLEENERRTYTSNAFQPWFLRIDSQPVRCHCSIPISIYKNLMLDCIVCNPRDIVITQRRQRKCY